ncbi:MAG: DUF547 domain-containing protein [Woeseiaceae bacterium]|nr:DUF547 domain-containing protein [Woeseiaceae bacterium]
MYGLLIIVALLVGGFALLNRPQFIPVDADIPVDFPTDTFSHRDFESLLEKYVDQDGNVDYTRWHSSQESVSTLNAYLAAVSRYSPDATPERFSSESQELAYWLYGYNAYVIKSVLDNWPLESVTDVKAPLEVVKGMGFFHRLRFEFGGEPYSLLSVENSIIRKRFQDARIHFVLNCASDSCPPMRPTLPTGDALDELLTAAATDFVNDPRNVSVDHGNKQVVLSTIVKWFRKDFLNDLAKRGLPSERGLVDYVSSEASETLRAELDAASGYEVVFRDYDWSLNGSFN